jgi:hypothetical protein
MSVEPPPLLVGGFRPSRYGVIEYQVEQVELGDELLQRISISRFP